MRAGKHFSLGEWVDYARGLMDASRAVLLEAHLEEGCRECQSLLHTLRGVAEAAAADPPDVPADVLARAKSLFLANAPAATGLLIATLVRDSFRDPLPAGVRSSPQVHRQALYEAGDYYIDIRLEREAISKLSLTGQVVSKKEPDKIFHSLPVLLFRADRILSRTNSNQSGEFWFDCKARRDLRIVIPALDSGVEIRLGELNIEETNE